MTLFCFSFVIMKFLKDNGRLEIIFYMTIENYYDFQKSREFFVPKSKKPTKNPIVIFRN